MGPVVREIPASERELGGLGMRVAYVGDNRDQVNWGGRGQSIALWQLLARHFEITGIVPGLWGASESTPFACLRS